MDEMIHRGRGLVDLIAGKLPTFTGWDNVPSDAADITDGDIATICTTGDKVIGAAWEYANFVYDLGGFYNVLITGAAYTGTTGANGNLFVKFWDGAAWIMSNSAGVDYTSNMQMLTVFGGRCSQVLVGITADAATTISPNIREINVWRL